ncbi:MAG: T4 RnlA family RNA ligase [Emticicia sp.]|nr:T4 RnlA family RNA ligase [Emticicia sp.]
MNIQDLKQLIADDYINVQKHPTADLYIYNYSPKAQYDRLWNEWTLACRGLIMNGLGEIVARPFQKFFNLEEVQNLELPNEPFEVYEKMDGSLGILYWNEEKPFIATRGSFTSEQAMVATELLHTKYADLIKHLDTTKTYLFEIIYPENRIVIDYGDERKLVLLAIIDTKSGNDCALENIGFEIVKRYDGLNDLQQLKALEEDNREGFVVKFKNGHRLKVKFAEYVRIHHIITRVSTTNIWEYLKEGQELLPILERVPDEFYDWVKATHAKLLNDFAQIEAEAQSEFKILATKKETALYYQTCKYPAILFKMMENRAYDHIIWKMIRPKFEKPFANKLEL